MKAGYRGWLEAQKYDAGTINAQMYRAGRVEEHHGNLDDHYANDRMASLIDSLKYSTDDKRHNRPIVLLGAALCAVITSITPKCLKSKAILLFIDDGEERAMGR